MLETSCLNIKVLFTVIFRSLEKEKKKKLFFQKKIFSEIFSPRSSRPLQRSSGVPWVPYVAWGDLETPGSWTCGPPPKKNSGKKKFFLFSSTRASEAPVRPTQDSQRSIKPLGSLRGGWKHLFQLFVRYTHPKKLFGLNFFLTAHPQAYRPPLSPTHGLKGYTRPQGLLGVGSKPISQGNMRPNKSLRSVARPPHLPTQTDNVISPSLIYKRPD